MTTKLPDQELIHFKVQLPAVPTANADVMQLFLAGDFNGWHTEDPTFELKMDESDCYQLDLPMAEGNYAFKVVRGGWETVEVARDGRAVENRTLAVDKGPGQRTVRLKIENWADNFVTVPIKSTAASNVQIMDDAFAMHLLPRKRRVWIYLPKDYHETDTRYSVLYLQDGQNIFDAATSFSGEWGVDEYLNSLSTEKQCIVLAVDNGGNKRMQEYNPYSNKKFGKGEGLLYVRFLVEALKPYVDQYYRTKPESRHTAIAGSSMGGLISFYAALQYPDVFGAAGIFSPSFWVAPQIYKLAAKQVEGLKASAFYFYGGTREDEDLPKQINKMTAILAEQPSLQQKTVIDLDGQHNEKYWQNAFPGFYSWLEAVMTPDQK